MLRPQRLILGLSTTTMLRILSRPPLENFQKNLVGLGIRQCTAWFNFLAGPTSWLQEFSPTFFAYRALFKVAPNFHGGRLNKRLVQTECPDPFVGPDGPAHKGTVAVRCTAKTAGGAMQHYFIPGNDLTPADPRKKEQECFILDGSYRGNILIVSKCNTKASNVDLKLMRDSSVSVNLRFDQVCVVEPTQV